MYCVLSVAVEIDFLVRRDFILFVILSGTLTLTGMALISLKR